MSVTLIAGVQYSRLVLAPSVLVWVWLRGNLFGPRCLTRLRCLSIRHLPFRQQMYFQMKIAWLIDFSNSSSNVTQKKGDSLSELQNFKEFNLVPLQCIRLQITSFRIGWIQSQGVFMLKKGLWGCIFRWINVPYTISQNLKNVSSFPKETLLLKVSN